jgi:DNA topoisomerase III
MVKLLANGRTDLLRGFVSNKTRHRKFSAFLVCQPTGKVGFEFAPRAEKPAAAANADEGGSAKPVRRRKAS